MKINVKPLVLIGLVFIAICNFSKGQELIIINEFMASNSNNLQDEDGTYSDWIEIYNSGSTDTSLAGWYLTDDITNLKKWSFPNIPIAANEYIVVFASNKDRKTDKTKLHTNFKLSGTGEFLALVKPGGTLLASAFSPGFMEQYQNISYGLLATEYSYLTEPTPGAANTGNIFITPPTFSVEHGFFDNAFSLELSSQTADADIYYTTNASSPSKTNGVKYTAPVSVSSTTVIRAITVKDGVGESFTKTQSYIFPNQVILQSENQPGYPTTWPSPIHGTNDYTEIPSNYSMKPAFVQLPEVNKVIVQSLKSLPVLSIVTDIDNFFSKSTNADTGGIYMYNGEPDGPTIGMKYHLGRGWERPISLEYFNSDATDGSIDFQANCGIKIHGGATRTRTKTQKHSFSVGFKSEYGPSKLETQLFGKGSPKQYDWLVLRGGFAPRLGQQIKDPWAKSTVRDMGQYASYSKFVHVFINGLYWGMYNLSERMDGNCMRDNLGGNPEDYDILKDYFEVESGDTIAWTKLVTMAATSIEVPANYQKLLGNNSDGTPNPSYEKLLNPDNLIDYIMMNMYAGTTDWDNHNWIAARRKTNSNGFNFLVWDAEGVFNDNIVTDIIAGGQENRPTGIFSDLMKNEQFKNQFISHVNKHFFESGALTPKHNSDRYINWFGQIDTALISDQARWVGNVSDIWNFSYHPYVKDYFPGRTELVFKQFINSGIYPRIDMPKFNTTAAIIPEDFKLMITAPAGGDIRYTLDGTDPGYFSLAESKSVIIYNNQPLPLIGDTINIWARVKKDTIWSILVKKRFIIERESASSTEELTNNSYLFNYPNPVNSFTNIVFSLGEPSHISVKIYNMLGVEVATIMDNYSDAGEQTITWNTENLPRGVYVCILENHSSAKTSRITLVKN